MIRQPPISTQSRSSAASDVYKRQIHHKRDQQRIITADNRQALANWMTEALVKDFKTNK